MRNYAFASFWVQLPLTIVSACILIFAVLYSKGVSKPYRKIILLVGAGVTSVRISTQLGCIHQRYRAQGSLD